MAKLAKLLQAAAGVGGAEALNVEDVFSTYLYTGNATARSITNNVDLSTEGGMVWNKARTTTSGNYIFDTERGASYYLQSQDTGSQESNANMLTSFNTDGFSIGSDANLNSNGNDFASWTFRKAPKFFDVVTYTGTGSAGLTIDHNLGSVPGCIIVKSTNDTRDWAVYHRGVDATAPEDYAMVLQKTVAREDNVAWWNDTAPTSTQFTVGNKLDINRSGYNYVAYLFAHNNSDGEFGPTGDQDIIKCGSYTGANPATIDLGFEPQWIMIKRSSGTGDWVMFDAMRGLVVEGNDAYLYANTSGSEVSNTRISITPTGFVTDTTDYRISSNGETYIYIAIRRGPMAVPESATDVFDIYQNESTATVPAWQHPFPVDFGVYKAASSVEDWWSSARLTQDRTLRLNTNDVESASSASDFDYMDGWLTSTTTQTDYHSWAWKRAPSFFDVVCYKGNAVEGHDISHNLGAVPEMIWVKNRETASQDWYVYHKDIGNTHYLRLNATSASVDSLDAWNDTTPTDSVFTVGGAGDVNWNNANHIAYLFASLDGVSKVGSYTGTGASGNQIDCGFSSGARFVLIKGTDTTYAWVVLDTERGLVSGSDKALFLNSTTSETTFDYADPYSAGFELSTSNIAVNGSGYNYIFYAIA
jgi:hypothetical protein